MAILSWLVLMIAEYFYFNTGEMAIAHYVVFGIRALLLNIFILSVFLFYKLTIGSFEGDGFNDLLWKSFVTGLIVTIILLINNVVNQQLTINLPGNEATIDYLSYHLTIAITIIFVSSNFFTFKRMILYQKSTEISNLWKIFEYLIYVCLVFNFLGKENSDILFSLSAIPILVMGIILALNLKWIAYLNFRQKWKSILYLAALLIFNILFIRFIFKHSTDYQIITDLADNLFVLSLFAFICFYGLFSILVLLFNLPTSSVFEQKFGEVINLQKLSKSSQMGKNEGEIYELLIDSCSGTFVASAAVLEIFK